MGVGSGIRYQQIKKNCLDTIHHSSSLSRGEGFKKGGGIGADSRGEGIAQ